MDRITVITFLVLLVAGVFRLASSEPTIYNITDYNAVPEDDADWTNQLVNAWTKACGSDGPATVVVPAGGTFFVRHAVLMGPCRSSHVSVDIGGTIVSPATYTSEEHWIVFMNVSGLTISGGLLDGRGQAIWNCKNSKRSCPNGATSLAIMNSNNVHLNSVSSMNSEMFHILIYGSRDVLVTGAHISAPGDSPNTDGIHIQESDGVTILGSDIATGDDCISIGPGTTNVWIETIKCGPGHGISIGSLGSEKMENGVKNVTAKHVEFTGTENGFRIKTWAKPSDGFVEHVLFQNATMSSVNNPIIIDQNYCPGNNGCPTQSSGIQINDVVFRDVEGTSATEVAVQLYCSPSKPCQNVWLMNINLRSNNETPTMSCSYVNGGSHGVISPPCCFAQ